MKWHFIDANEDLIFSFISDFPQRKDELGKYTDDSIVYAIFERNIFMYSACERHKDHLHSLIVYPTLCDKID